MTLLLGVLLASAAVTIATTLGWVGAFILSAVSSPHTWAARSRATLLAQMRLLPLACTLLLVAAQVHAFVRFETSRPESPGALLIALAAVGLLLVLDALARGARMWNETVKLVITWRRAATPLLVATWTRPAWAICPSYPVVAVVGVFRPQLFVARQVVERCTPAEMAAIAAHEAAHVAARDNLVRLLFALTPGARLVPHLSAVLEQRWLAAAEEAADSAACGGHTAALDLASALTKVARLAPAAPPLAVASTLIGASDLEARVKRLVQPPSRQHRHRAAWFPSVLLLVLALVAQLPAFGASLHEVFELLVRSH